jgi:hypothetical protein
MLTQDRTIWLQVTHAIEALSASGRAVWSQPSAVQKALGELLGVFPATHVQLNLDALFHPGDGKEDWAALLSRSGQWSAFLSELALAITEAVRPPVVWGIGLPGPQYVAASLGDTSERGVVKAGLQVASFLQALREARVGFVTVDLRGTAVASMERAIAPVFRNSGMYGWKRAVCADDIIAISGSFAGADIGLVPSATITELSSLWNEGKLVGGGCSAAFWTNGSLEEKLPAKFFLYGEAPEGIAPKVLVEAGRFLRA